MTDAITADGHAKEPARAGDARTEQVWWRKRRRDRLELPARSIKALGIRLRPLDDDPDTDPRFPGGVIRVDPVTGAQTTASSGGSFVDPIGITVEADGTILIADRFAGPTFFTGGLIRVDPANGAQTILSSLSTGDDLTNPTAVAVEADGNIIAATSDGGLHRVDPVTGAASLLTFAAHNGVAVVPPLSPRLPNSKEDCKKGGWRNYPQFKNQGQCIVFVHRGPK